MSNTITLWKATRWSSSCMVEPVTVDRFTDSSVWINNRRRSRSNRWSTYFENQEDAESWVRERLENELKEARLKVDSLTRQLEKLNRNE